MKPCRDPTWLEGETEETVQPMSSTRRTVNGAKEVQLSLRFLCRRGLQCEDRDGGEQPGGAAALGHCRARTVSHKNPRRASAGSGQRGPPSPASWIWQQPPRCLGGGTPGTCTQVSSPAPGIWRLPTSPSISAHTLTHTQERTVTHLRGSCGASAGASGAGLPKVQNTIRFWTCSSSSAPLRAREASA